MTLARIDLYERFEVVQNFIEKLPTIKDLTEIEKKIIRFLINKEINILKEKIKLLETLTKTYNEILVKPFGALNEKELQIAHDTLLELFRHQNFDWWEEELCQKGTPLQGFHWIKSEPPNAKLYVNGKFIGKTPVLYTFYINEPPTYEIRWQGFLPVSTILSEKAPWRIQFKLRKE